MTRSIALVQLAVRRAWHGLGPETLSCLVTILVAAALVLGVPLAHASVPDPLWIAGIYDAADDDDVVQAVTDGSGLRLPASEGPTDLAPEPSIPSLGIVVVAPPSLHARSSRLDRAPPHR